ncbi:hypothetical protein PG999_006640 [Apiospora kogelbergensis]|uniref:Ecp2 effector protein-like domain-containing protein n=1 Tax=Apiospora kogelbergensis TaxID=1337665 RepID=A0AAW0QW16_9PEZI
MIFNFTRVFGLWALVAPTALAVGMRKLDGQQYEDKCAGTTWEDKTSNESPLAEDCLKLAKQFENGHYGWFLNGATPDTYAELGHVGTCGFGVEPVVKEGVKATNFFFGAADLHDLVFDATMRFRSQGGRIGATGVTQCDDTTVRWGVYHTPI